MRELRGGGGARKEARDRQKSLLLKKKKSFSPKDASFHCEQICAESSQSGGSGSCTPDVCIGALENGLSLKSNFCFTLKNRGVCILIYRREHIAGSAPLVSAVESPSVRGLDLDVPALCLRQSFRLGGVGTGNQNPMFEGLFGSSLWWAT